MENSEKNNLENESKLMKFEELCDYSLKTYKTLFSNDKFLTDLPADVTIEEVNSQLSVAHGHSFVVELLRYTDVPLNIVIPQRNCKVHQLKNAIRRSVELKLKRARSRTKISWNYVWKTYLLKNIDYMKNAENFVVQENIFFRDLGPIMYDDNAFVCEHFIRNATKIKFIRKLNRVDYSRQRTYYNNPYRSDWNFKGKRRKY